MTHQKQNLDNIPLKTLIRIKQNQFRSADCTQDYCPFEVEERIMALKIKEANKMLKLEEVEPIIDFDHQLSGLMSVTMPGKNLLAIIDYALKCFEPKEVKRMECDDYRIAIGFTGEANIKGYWIASPITHGEHWIPIKQMDDAQQRDLGDIFDEYYPKYLEEKKEKDKWDRVDYWIQRWKDGDL